MIAIVSIATPEFRASCTVYYCKLLQGKQQRAVRCTGLDLDGLRSSQRTTTALIMVSRDCPASIKSCLYILAATIKSRCRACNYCQGYVEPSCDRGDLERLQLCV